MRFATRGRSKCADPMPTAVAPASILFSSNSLTTEAGRSMTSPAAMREIQQGRAAIASGDVVTKDEIEALRSQLRSKTA